MQRRQLLIGSAAVIAAQAADARAAWNLHASTRHLPLELFALFSSDVAVLGSGGFGADAGVSAFQDALARAPADNGLGAALPLAVYGEGLTLDVPDGSLALVGENGSGKTTLLSIAGGLLTPTAGTVVVAGQEQHFLSCTKPKLVDNAEHSLTAGRSVQRGGYEVGDLGQR